MEAAQAREEEITIYLTNITESTVKLEEEYPPDEYGYTLEYRAEDASYVTVDLA